VRSVLVPALVLDIGQKIWWPSRLAVTDGEHRPEPELEEEQRQPVVA
jgi:putative drug exporter of the RND superfamily